MFGYYKFVTAVKNINLLPNRDNVIAEKKAKFFSNFAFKGVIGIVSWNREFATCDPDYYKFEQKMFIDFFPLKTMRRKRQTFKRAR